ncbi:MAG: hypothetical protein HY359_04480 [Candidatus Rokubacteria bacterium]|nr:hypothetical protein [Candidatus Rokubacteria bacterium]
MDRAGAGPGTDLALVVTGDGGEAIRVRDRDGRPVPHRLVRRGGARLVVLQPGP